MPAYEGDGGVVDEDVEEHQESETYGKDACGHAEVGAPLRCTINNDRERTRQQDAPKDDVRSLPPPEEVALGLPANRASSQLPLQEVLPYSLPELLGITVSYHGSPTRCHATDCPSNK